MADGDRSKIADLWSMLAKSETAARSAALAAMLFSVTGLVSTVIADKFFKPDEVVVPLRPEAVENFAKLIAAQTKRTAELTEKVSKAARAEPLRTSEYDLLQKQIAEVVARQQRIENVILTNPGKALEVPMLRRDIDANAKNTDSSLASMQHSVDRVYDQNKYVMLTIFASIVLLAISTFIKVGKKSD